MLSVLTIVTVSATLFALVCLYRAKRVLDDLKCKTEVETRRLDGLKAACEEWDKHEKSLSKRIRRLTETRALMTDGIHDIFSGIALVGKGLNNIDTLDIDYSDIMGEFNIHRSTEQEANGVHV